MTSSAAFRCVQAWLLEKPAAWADEDAPCIAAAGLPATCNASGPARTRCSRPSARTSGISSRSSIGSFGETQCRMELERENRHLRRRVGGLNEIIDRAR